MKLDEETEAPKKVEEYTEEDEDGIKVKVTAQVEGNKFY